MGIIAKAVHLSFDAVLISAFLAGVKRSTGLTIRAEQFSDNPQVKGWIDSYLGAGEWVMDKSVILMSTSGFFERKR